jgi:hypothetical protein
LQRPEIQVFDHVCSRDTHPMQRNPQLVRVTGLRDRF